MAVVWETPPNPPSGVRGRGRTELREEADKMLVEMVANPERWARMWDMGTKEEAQKRQNFVQKKGFSFAVRQTEAGWSVFGKCREDYQVEDDVKPPREPAAPKSRARKKAANPQEDPPEEMRESTF